MIYDTGLLWELDAMVQDMQVSNQDLPIAIFGKEGRGKSTFAENLAVYLDRTFTADEVRTRVAQTTADFYMKTPDVQAYHVIWWDEAHRFSKRGSYDNQDNRYLLEYFQDIRGRKRIYLLCFPELKEIDRKVIQRCRLFFECIRIGTEFWVRGWTQQQIEATIECYRLPSKKAKDARWMGLSYAPKRVFRHDYKDFPDASKISARTEPIPSVVAVNEAYKLLKEGSLRRSDEILKERGFKEPIDVANEIMLKTKYTWVWAKELALNYTKLALQEGWSQDDEVIVVNGRYKIKSNLLFDKIVEAALANRKLVGNKRGARTEKPVKNGEIRLIKNNDPVNNIVS